MNKCIEVIVIVEGKTEQLFVKQTLSKYLEKKEIYLRATQVSKPGQKGGDVKCPVFDNWITQLENIGKQF